MSELATPPSGSAPASSAGAAPPASSPGPAPGPGGRPWTSWVRLGVLVAGIVALGVFGSVSALVVVIALVIMIFLHELGHYVAARASGMKVTEFFIGFGPRIFSYRRGETEYGLKVIPAGAYVRIIGMNNLDPVDPAEEGRTYRQASYPRRLAVGLAGSAMHFLIALVLLFVLLVGYGVPRVDTWDVGSVSTTLEDGSTSPAGALGLQPGDRIVSIDQIPTPTFDDAVAVIQVRGDQPVTVTWIRDGVELSATAVLAQRELDGEMVGFLGVGPTYPLVRESVPAAAVESVTQFGRITGLSVQALASFFSPGNLGGYVDQLMGRTPTQGGQVAVEDAENRLLSPVGAVRIASQAADAGIPQLLNFLVAINIFIGLFNLIPLLPLDGGHVAIATYERIRSRKGRRYFADVTKLLPVTYAVVVVLILLGVSALYLDLSAPIADPFSP